MWKFKPFAHRQPTSLEGRSLDVGNMKVHVRNSIAEGGFSCVYLARDAIHPTRQYALKHIICNDGESLENVMKEISVMKLLMGHPNITKLFSYAIMDMGRTKEALLVMEFCEMSLVTFLENRVEFFEEKHILLLFRDVCNAVFAMHCLKPTIAHRDLKAENVLLGADGAWKLCDFGSTSTNHKCFTKPEEMGIEEDNIRKHTTPAYRAPEMWDLYRRDVISEKVDIWALGCLLYRICFLKSAFDGESKLQITNVHYHLPETPRYSQTVIGLVKDMIQGSPDARPDITQVWFRVNELLPMELQKHLPNSCPTTNDSFHSAKLHQERVPKGDNMTHSPQPASKEHGQRISATSIKERHQPEPSRSAGKARDNGLQIGSFWSTQHEQNSHVVHDKAPTNQLFHEIRASPMETKHISQKPKSSHMETKSTSLNNTSVPFSTHTDQPITGNTSVSFRNNKNATEEQTELKILTDQLKQANLDKAEIASKYEKLSAICQSQRQEIDKLRRALVAATASPSSKNNSKSHASSASLQSINLQKEKLDPNILELEQAMAANSSVQATATETSVSSTELQPWQTFDEDPKAKLVPSSVVGLSPSTNGARNTRVFNHGDCVSSQCLGNGLEKLGVKHPNGWAGF